MDSPFKVNIQHVRKEAVQQAENEVASAETTEQKHRARLALQRAQRTMGSESD